MDKLTREMGRVKVIRKVHQHLGLTKAEKLMSVLRDSETDRNRDKPILERSQERCEGCLEREQGSDRTTHFTTYLWQIQNNT